MGCGLAVTAANSWLVVPQLFEVLRAGSDLDRKHF